jgi:hypothetical protein
MMIRPRTGDHDNVLTADCTILDIRPVTVRVCVIDVDLERSARVAGCPGFPAL